MNNLQILLIAAMLLGISKALPYTMTTVPQDVQVKEGEEVVLYCAFEGNAHLILWQNDSKVISVGRELYASDPRLAIIGTGKTYNLQFTDVDYTDEGVWGCQVGSTTQKNTITIVVPPTITPTPDEGRVEVSEGEDLTLKCDADGTPNPNVTWTKQGDAEFSMVGMELTLRTVNQNAEGIYTCHANNGIDDGDEAMFDICVMFPVTVNVPETKVHTGPGRHISFSCEFSGNPEPNIVWQLNNIDINLEQGSHVIVANVNEGHYGLKSTLEIKSVKAADIGVYTCIGGNKQESQESESAVGTINLSGLPENIEFLSDIRSKYSDAYTVVWQFYSIPVPNECELNITDTRSFFGMNVIPAVAGDEDTHNQEFYLAGLTVDTEYQINLNCKNQFGQVTKPFTFYTAADENPAPLPTTTLEPKEDESTLHPTLPSTLSQIPIEIDTTTQKASALSTAEIEKELATTTTATTTTSTTQTAIDVTETNVGGASGMQSWTFGTLLAIVVLLACLSQ